MKDLVCRKCGCKVYRSSNPEYKYQCYNCDEDLYGFEVRRRGKNEPPKPVRVAYEAGDGLEYLTNKYNESRVFVNQTEAELQLISEGIPACDIKYLRFLEVD